MLLDKFLPKYEFNEIHTVTVDAIPEHVFIAIKELTPAELSPIIFWMLDLRNLPARLVGKTPPSVAQQSKPFLNQMYEGGFLQLAEETNSEIAFGMIGQPWKLTGGIDPDIPTPQAFLDFDDPAFAKIAANLAITVGGDGRTHCSTETRIHVPDPNTRRKFAFYWRIISMGSGWIRALWLKAIKRIAENQSV
ncbi:hypothetical protein ANAEL_02119 [Anaerolineales bacterium]|nr:hypothetical protein ANAEL_02119 [Anaerolineales bacterium]